MPEDTTKIVVLGGGYAGIEAAKRLEKKFRHSKEVSITLIDRNRYHTLMTELHEVAGGRVEPDSVQISYQKIFGARKVRIVQDTIEDIDFEKKELKSSSESYPYDYMVLSTGAEPADFGIPGIKEHAYTLWSLEDALAIRHRVEDLFRRASREKDPVKRAEMLTFTVVGGGFTGVEMMGELLEERKTLCRRHGIQEDEVRLVLVEALDTILNILSEKPRKKARRYLEKKGVEIRTNSMITDCSADGLTCKDGTAIPSETVIWTAGVQASSFAANLDMPGAKAGRKVVQATMECPDRDGVYAAGDNLWFESEEEGPVPQIVEAALQTAETAAHNIGVEVSGKGKKKPLKPRFHGFMVSLGGKYAVSETAGLKLSHFPAMALKHLINLHYQFGVAGVNACWNYLRHEILEIKEGRSLIGGLAAWRTRGYWIAFLRMFLGVNWLIEGSKKVMNGWLNPEYVQPMFQNPADAGSSATGTGEWAAEGAEAAAEAGQALLAEPMALYTWMMETFVYQAPLVFQFGIVIIEILLGLAFLGGLLTWLASIGSIGLNLMFLMAAMAGPISLWYIAVSIVMLGGAGRAFGLDYWAVPWMKHWWNGTRLAKKTYLYLGEPTR